MFEAIHTVHNKGRSYEYPCMRSAKRRNGKHITKIITYGNKRTKEQAMEEMNQWLEK